MKSVTDNLTSTRDIILHAIKMDNEATVNDLAEAADISPVTVRHHLNSLQAEGLLVSRAVRRKVGRPYYVYSLSEKGHELFPQRYVRLSSRLLEELKTNFPAGTVAQLFKSVVRSIIEEHRSEFENLSFEERLSYVAALLTEEGFLAQWEQTAEGYRLTEHSCPYLSVGEKHSEVCTFDSTLIEAVMRTEIKQHSCMLSGADCCEFTLEDNNRPQKSIQIEVI